MMKRVESFNLTTKLKDGKITVENDSKESADRRKLVEEAKKIGPSKPPALPDDLKIMSGWMKMKNSMKLWPNRWFVLRPGRLMYYKDEKEHRCSGELQLEDCKVQELNINKDGFSFKIYHLLHYPIFHKVGLKGEILKMTHLPVSWDSSILRVTSEQERKNWMDAIKAQIAYANTYRTEEDPADQGSPPTSEEEEDMDKQRGKDELQKNLMDGLRDQQQSTVKSLQRDTLKMMGDWKQDVEGRISSMERKLLQALSTSSLSSESFQISYLQFIAIVVFCIFISKYLWQLPYFIF